eukprot:CAMPEP_0173178478 /NCGR_PEP_ID=MMETSP1141-20130122/5562_1 /TAXON_ID=483371 /ORGANISM="non described non described, Strain CCMP2298" /LENGTH=392 /DNA_ID=CAMNT_0014100981 /DNA_START=47 /DNA_END=1225 /DNA_ORIENTATION=-
MSHRTPRAVMVLLVIIIIMLQLTSGLRGGMAHLRIRRLSILRSAPDSTTSNEYLGSIFGLAGKTALVTGATGGLGSAIAEALYRAGANVVLAGRSEAKLEALVQRLQEQEQEQAESVMVSGFNVAEVSVAAPAYVSISGSASSSSPPSSSISSQDDLISASISASYPVPMSGPGGSGGGSSGYMSSGDIVSGHQKHGLLSVSADITKDSDTQHLLEQCIAQFGGLDIVVNNAGMNLLERPFESNTQDDWNLIQNINLNGAITLTRQALPYLRRSSAGRIINIASIGAHVGLPNNTLYAITKAGLLMFTKSLAAELAQTSVTVNSISPGIMTTPMNSKFAVGTSAHDQVVEMIPAKRMGMPADMAGAVLFLASQASSYTTGADLIIDGGYSAV